MARGAAEIGSTLRAKGRDVVASSYRSIESPVFYKFHEVLKRHAVCALVDHVGEPLRDVIDAYFLTSHGDQLAAIAMSEGALDLIRGHAEELDDDTVKRLLARAIKTGLGPVRQAAYRVGAERFGLDYARPALKDSARMVRDWAQEVPGRREDEAGFTPAKMRRSSNPARYPFRQGRPPHRASTNRRRAARARMSAEAGSGSRTVRWPILRPGKGVRLP